MMYNAMDTERYVWGSRRRLANERPRALELHSAEDDASWRTIFGRKTAEVTRCALSGESGG